ncbi:calcium-binding protein [Microvirga aerilata]|uniref:calcium-binding protein n=1 Tax=Microvirga aerilata TaxID=670292 RepID=UPI00362BE276
MIEGFEGSAYADELTGSFLNNVLYGNGGNDTLEGSVGGDLLYGGEGYDFASYYNAFAGVVANLSDASQNTFEAKGDTYDSIEALAGSKYDDSLTGNGENNNLYGHDGNDWLSGLVGRDYLVGGAGDDTLSGGAGGDWLIGGAGFDSAAYNTAVTANLLESWRNTGDAAGDEYDSIEGLFGSNYADHLTGNNDHNIIHGGSGQDILVGMSGNDHLLAGHDDDRLEGGAGADTLDGGEGFDLVSYASSWGSVQARLGLPWINSGGAAGDTYVSIEGLIGSSFNDGLSGNEAANRLLGEGGNDELYGDGGADTLSGGDGADGLYGGTGADVLDGGAGFDFACYNHAASGVRASLSAVTAFAIGSSAGEASGDTFVSIEALSGSAYADHLTGNEGYNELFGHNGNDELFGLGDGDWLVGGEGHDLLVGGAGCDALSGGNGTDIFRFDSALGAGNVDVVNDFGYGGPDLLQLSRSVFTAFANQGSVDSWQFTIGAAASAASHRLIYNSSTGAVSYDADGAGVPPRCSLPPSAKASRSPPQASPSSGPKPSTLSTGRTTKPALQRAGFSY